jgi:hypothetical protein
MKMGADRKRLAFLGALVLIGGYEFYDNVLSGPSSSTPSAPSRPVRNTATPAAPAYAAKKSTSVRPVVSSRTSEEFRPSLKPKRPEDRVDPMTIDPTLRLDLLAKVQAVEMQGGSRNLFTASAAPPQQLPPEPKVKPGQLAPGAQQAGPVTPPPPPGPPPPPPITLKYYGYSSARGDSHKRAFFLDGEDILVGSEGDIVKKRYRVVRIGVNSVVMEDTQFKHEQTLPLQEEAGAGAAAG